MVYEAQGRDVPTILSENFDPSIFANIYAEKEQRERRAREYRERAQQVVNLAMVQLPLAPFNNIPGAVIDVDMQDDDDPDWEVGSGVDSEESEGVGLDQGGAVIEEAL